MTIEQIINEYNKTYKEQYPQKGFFVISDTVTSNKTFPILKTIKTTLTHIPSKLPILTVQLEDKIEDSKLDQFKEKNHLKFINIFFKEINKIPDYVV